MDHGCVRALTWRSKVHVIVIYLEVILVLVLVHLHHYKKNNSAFWRESDFINNLSAATRVVLNEGVSGDTLPASIVFTV